MKKKWRKKKHDNHSKNEVKKYSVGEGKANNNNK